MNNVVPLTSGNANVPALIRRRVTPENFFEGVEWFIQGVSIKSIAELWVVPIDLVRRLVATKEFRDTVRAMRDDVLGTELAVLTRSIHIGLRQSVERLEIGDPYIDDKGDIKYKPVSAKDAAAIASMLMDRRDKVENKLAPKGTGDEENALKDLVALAAALDTFKRTRKSNMDTRVVIDVDPMAGDDDETP